MNTLTRAYRSESMELITQTHRQDYFGSIKLTEGTAVTTLSVVDGDVAFSEDWSPRMQAHLTVANTFNLDQLQSIDPRTPRRLEIYAGYYHPGNVPDVRLLATGQLDERVASSPGDMIELTLSNAETAAQECRWLAATVTRSFPGVIEALTYFIGQATAPNFLSLDTDIPPVYRPDLTAGMEVETGASMWDLIDTLSQSAGLRVYVADDGRWHVGRKTTIAGLTRAFLTQDDRGIVSTAEDILSRDGYYTAAAIKYMWNDGTTDREILGTWAPTPAPGIERGAGQKTYYDERPGPISQAAANETARLTVASLSTRGNSYVLEAVAAYWLREGDTVQVRLLTGVDVRHIVKQVTFHLSAGTMTVITREPTNLGTED